MQFLESEIVELTKTVWETVLAMEIEQVPDEKEPDEDVETVSACVHISGEWVGSTIVTCPKSVAVGIACQMFELEPDDADEELVHDAVGEIVNMIGGNVKGLVPGPSQLSLPAVATGIHTRLAVPGSKPITVLSFRTGGEPVRVVLTKSDGNGSTAEKNEETQEPSPAEVG